MLHFFKKTNKLDVVYHVALLFVTGASAHTHHCNLYKCAADFPVSKEKKNSN